MNIQLYILQYSNSPLEKFKLVWLRNRHVGDKNQNELLQFKIDEQLGDSDLKGNLKKSIMARVNKAREYQLGTLLRAELSRLSEHNIQMADWDEAIHVAIEEEEYTNTPYEKLECLRRLLIGYMCKKDYLRASVISERLQQLFPEERFSNQQDEFNIFNDAHEWKHVEEVIFMLIILAIVRNNISDYVKRLYQSRPTLSVFGNDVDRLAYNFVFAVIFDSVPSEKAYFGDTIEVLKDDQGLKEFLVRDPWLSDSDSLNTVIVDKLKGILKARLLNVDCCPNELVRKELQSLFV